MKLNKYAKLSGITFGSIKELNKNFIIGRFVIYNYDETEEQFMKILENRTVRLTIETEESILDEKEREYLSVVIRPFRDDVKFICKNDNYTGHEYINIGFYKNDNILFPCFKKGSMYKGMKLNKEYELEELGL